ncbi:hypothetical protein K474DRAFT_1746054 [Panus rudis PR-1116 ss-1]|nr:hypothetical protein K474DRAFT_1746054 [Panus rudis PR-1116 ss-1]
MESAQVAKEKGNAAFKAGDYPTAIGHYSAAIVADPQNATYPLNRAAAYLKLQKHEDAERDCSKVIGLDAKNVKAWFRRAQARIGMEKYQEALAGKLVTYFCTRPRVQIQQGDRYGDLREAAKLEASNQDVRREISKTEGALRAKEARVREKASHKIEISPPKLPNAPSEPSSSRDVKPSTSSAGPSSSKTTTAKSAEPKPAASSRAASRSQPEGDELMKPISSRPLTSSSPAEKIQRDAQPAVPSTEPRSSSPQRSKREPVTAPLPAVGGGIFRPNGNHTIITTKPNEASSGASVGTSSKASSEKKNTPTTLFTFLRIWESLSLPEQRWAFIQQISPTSLPAVFRSSLEATTLTSMLQTFQAVLQLSPNVDDDAQTIKEYMTNLPRVPRWSTILLFLGPDERKVIAGIWEKLPTGDGDEKIKALWGL